MRLLVVFNTVDLFGMERSVIETLDSLRPEVQPHFLLSRTTLEQRLPVYQEVTRRGLSHSFFSDFGEWPRIGKPQTTGEAARMAGALIRGNLDVLKICGGYDAIYLSSLNYASLAGAGLLLFRLTGRRILYRFHDLIEWPDFKLRILSWLVTDFFHNTRTGMRKVMGCNPYLASKRNAVLPSRLEPRLCGDAVESARVAEEMGRGRNLVFSGRIAEDKGIFVLLQAFGDLSPSYPDLRLHILGTGRDDAVQRVRRSLEDPVHGSKIRYWGYRGDVHSFLGKAYVYVQPSLPSMFQESFGRGVLEAMSMGVPTVCFDSGALSESVQDGVTGLICEEETAVCLGRSIRRFLDDPDFRDQCGRSGLRRFQEKHAPEVVRRLWLEELGVAS